MILAFKKYLPRSQQQHQMVSFLKGFNDAHEPKN